MLGITRRAAALGAAADGHPARLYGALGPNWSALLDKLDVIVNQKWPQVL